LARVECIWGVPRGSGESCVGLALWGNEETLVGWNLESEGLQMSAKNSERMKRASRTPKQIAAFLERMNSPEVKARRRESMTRFMERAWQRPEFRDRMIRAMNRPEVKTWHKESMKIVWQIPESRAKHIEVLNSPEVRAKISGENNGAWKGGTTFLPYCPKFNDSRREEVRNDHERVCASCGKSELFNSRHLCVHHVDGDKMQGCKHSDWFGLGGRWFLVPLCDSCHSKGLERDLYSVGKFWLAELARKYWERRVAA